MVYYSCTSQQMGAFKPQNMWMIVSKKDLDDTKCTKIVYKNLTSKY